jgi:hypothetical protein
MISIQNHLAIPHAEVYLNQQAENHWERLNGTRVDGSFRKTALIQKIHVSLAESFNDEYRKNFANDDAVAAARHQRFFEYLTDFDNFNLHEIIIAAPKDLELIKCEVMSILWPVDLYFLQNGGLAQTVFGRFLSEELFAYQKFRRSSSCKKLITAIGFDSVTCPYCNYNQLDLVPNLGTPNVLDDATLYLDLDHFFSKSQHPFFGVSFFNLIPACHSCNSVDKGAKLFSVDTQMHPYVHSFDDYFKFRVSLVAILGDPIDRILIDAIIPRPLDQSIENFNLLAKYDHLLSAVFGLIERFVKFKKYIGTPQEADFVELLLGDIPTNNKDILRHSCAKFKRDILAQLDVGDALKIR